jgi:NTE family protein
LDLHVMPPLCPLTVPVTDFTQAETLIRRARDDTGAWLDAGSDLLPSPQRFLSLHHHQAMASRATTPLADVPVE